MEAVSEAGSVRWVGPEHLHLTLKFLGDTPELHLPAIADAVERVAGGAAPARLQLGDVDAFPSVSRPRVIWAGVEGDLHALAALHQSLEQALSSLAIAPDGRAFTPHITLGRVRENARPAAVQRLATALTGVRFPEPPLQFETGRLVLFQSTLTPRGPSYTSLAEGAIGSNRP